MIGLALFVYIRPELTKRVIESVRRNCFEKIYIFQDGLKNEADRENWEEVSKMIYDIDFAETEIHIAKKNKGLADSIIDGMNYVFEKHEEAVALEDDVILADGYKDFIQALFEKYRDNKKIMSICGGGGGVVIPPKYIYDIYFSYRMSSIAFGTWKNRWEGFQRDPQLLTSIYCDPEKKKYLDYAGNDVEKMVVDSLKGKCDTWATYWELYQINNLGMHIIPVDGYAKDIGREGGGTNTKVKTIRYDTELNGKAKKEYKFPDEIVIDKFIVQDTKNLMDVVDDKFFSYFNILCTWLEIYQKKLNILDYFMDKNILNIYIYGTGRLADFLYHDIQHKIGVMGYIVEKRQQEKYNGKKVYDMRDYKGLEDFPIVITPSYDMAFIRHFFSKCKIENEVILIDDVVKYALDKKGN